jgi:uncharacterized protein
MKRLLPGLLACALLAALAAAGPVLPPAPTRHVTDHAGVLPSGTVRALEEKLSAFEAETSSQFLVYIDRKLPEGAELEEWTLAVARAWRAGQKERNNGLVLFVFPDSRAARFEVGYGLEGALPDALAGRILQNEAIPRFRNGDWDGGIRAAVDAAIAATKGEYKGTGRAARNRRDEGAPIPLWVVLLVLFVVLPILRGGSRRKYWYIGGGGFGGGGFGGGFGGGGGGGWSGGGGSFGGGGASGRW